MKTERNIIIEKCCEGSFYSKIVKFLFDSANTAFAATAFLEWEKNFISIHGELNTQRKIDIKELENIFSVSISGSTQKLFLLIFCLETYYSIILRFIAYKAIFKDSAYSDEIFHPGTFASHGIMNYNCVAYYDWFLSLNEFQETLSELFSQVNVTDRYDTGDLISNIFETIFPKAIRHSLGEFYTPYWLAEYIIDRLTADDNNRHLKSFLDPSCGSGTFIVALIRKFRKDSGNTIFKNVCGIDINPLTVLAAKTNYLLLYGEQCHQDNNLEIPIYCADTIAINDKYHSLFECDNDYDKVPRVEFDYIVGNPPWVNWEYLPTSYRQKHSSLWLYYNLYTQKGFNANFIKEDISVLMTYVVIDNYLKKDGMLGFVIKETLFKSIKQGEGFRYFRIQPSKTDLKVCSVDDLTPLKPFKGAATRTALLFIKKGEKTSYPVDYFVWYPKKGSKSLSTISKAVQLPAYIEQKHLLARPSVPKSLNSGWITESTKEMEYSQHVLGSNTYIARTGVFTGGANGIFWLKIESESAPNTVIVSNITERAKNRMRNVSAEIEKDFIFPFLTGHELNFWEYSYSKYILCPHTAKSRMYPIDSEVLKTLPKTEAYLLSFKKELKERKGFTSMDERIHQDYYYTLQRIGEYTFSKYKVCWRYISKSFTPAVIEYADDDYLGTKNIIGNEKIISIGLDDGDEAYYLCGIISSTVYRKTIENYMVGTQITPSIINKLNIPPYDSHNDYQVKISELCKKGHRATDKTIYVKAIDRIVKDWLLS